MVTVAVFGAAGKMGTRISERLREDAEIELVLVEADPAGRARIEASGLSCASAGEAAAAADAVVLAVPDWIIGPLAGEIVPDFRPGTLLVCLDPAAPYAGHLPERADVAYFVCHPAHPPIFNDETDEEARRDYFGSGKARQSIVNALLQGDESDYELGEQLARKMWGPILRSHRVTLEQMALLEPALSETVLGTCLTVIREGLDEAVARGVPSAAAWDFVMGHLNAEMAIIFDMVPWSLSDGALMAIDDAKRTIFQPDWRRVFEPESLRTSVERITAPRGA